MKREILKIGLKNKDIHMEETPVWLYSLSTCSICKDVKKLLQKKDIEFKTIDVDRLEKSEQTEILEILKAYNPKLSFPTLVIGDEVILGYNKEKITQAIKTITASKGFFNRIISAIKG